MYSYTRYTTAGAYTRARPRARRRVRARRRSTRRPRTCSTTRTTPRLSSTCRLARPVRACHALATRATTRATTRVSRGCHAGCRDFGARPTAALAAADVRQHLLAPLQPDDLGARGAPRLSRGPVRACKSTAAPPVLGTPDGPLRRALPPLQRRTGHAAAPACSCCERVASALRSH